MNGQRNSRPLRGFPATEKNTVATKAAVGKSIPTLVRLTHGDRQKLEAVRLKYGGGKLSDVLRQVVREGIDWHLFGRHPAAGARPVIGGKGEDRAEPPVPGSETPA